MCVSKRKVRICLDVSYVASKLQLHIQITLLQNKTLGLLASVIAVSLFYTTYTTKILSWNRTNDRD